MLFVAAIATALDLAAAPPVLNWLSPVALVPGATNKVILSGQNLEGVTALWTSFGGQMTRAGAAGAAEFLVPVDRQTPEGIAAVRVVTTNGLSGMTLVLLDRLATRTAGATNRSAAMADTIQTPGAVEGWVEELGSRYFRFAVRKGDHLSMEVVARRLGSSLDPWLRLTGPDGRELSINDDTAGLSGDARIDFTCTQSGEHLVELRDTRFEGGARHRYRLRIGPALPTPLDFLGSRELGLFSLVVTEPPATLDREPNGDAKRAQRVELPAWIDGRFHRAADRDVFSFAVKAGEQVVFSGRTRSVGSAGELVLRVESTNGATVAVSNPGAADGALLTNRFSTAGDYRLVIEELNGAGGERHGYRVEAEPLRPGFSLSTTVERISARAGEGASIEVRAQRRDFTGPIRLSVVEPTGFIRSSELVIPSGTNVVRIDVSAPAEARLGEHRMFGIVGRATIGGIEAVQRASTLPALSNAMSAVRWVPRELDGVLMFSVSEEASSTPAAESRGRKRKK